MFKEPVSKLPSIWFFWYLSIDSKYRVSVPRTEYPVWETILGREYRREVGELWEPSDRFFARPIEKFLQPILGIRIPGSQKQFPHFMSRFLESDTRYPESVSAF